jgi:ABC-type phosphate/phosphonate transport system, periplasmic component
MDRRSFMQAVGLTGTVAVAGCTGGGGNDGESAETVGEWADDGTIEFGLPPFQDAEELNAEYQPVFDWIADGFDGVDTVEGVQTTSYSATVESVANGHTEMANLSPIIAVLARDDGVNPIAINWSHGAEAYYSYIATRAETEIDRWPTSRMRRLPWSTRCRQAADSSPDICSHRPASTLAA